jgi:lycopene cyclase domain-containing protein
VIPEYTLATITLLAGALGIAAWRGIVANAAVVAGLVVFAITTVLADLVLTWLPIVTYGSAQRSGLSIGPMPLEDLGYAIALYLVAVTAWRTGPGAAEPRR